MSRWHSSQKSHAAWLKRLREMRCYYCGRPGGTVDHRTPPAKGGRTRPENCVPACKWCNERKADRTQEEFETWLTRLGQRLLTEAERAELFPGLPCPAHSERREKA